MATNRPKPTTPIRANSQMIPTDDFEVTLNDDEDSFGDCCEPLDGLAPVLALALRELREHGGSLRITQLTHDDQGNVIDAIEVTTMTLTPPRRNGERGEIRGPGLRGRKPDAWTVAPTSDDGIVRASLSAVQAMRSHGYR